MCFMQKIKGLMVIMKVVLMLYNLASSWHRCCPNKSIYFIRILIFVDLFVCIKPFNMAYTLGYCCTKCVNKIISIKTLLCGISQNGNIFIAEVFWTHSHTAVGLITFLLYWIILFSKDDIHCQNLFVSIFIMN